MDIIISHKTAFLFWRRFTGSRGNLPRARRTAAMGEPLNLTPEVEAELAELGIEPRTESALHILFARDDLRSRVFGVRSHVSGLELPAGSLLRISPHVLIAGPELTFAQLARRLPFGQLVMAGCELCGTYALVPGKDGNDIVERASLTSAERLRSFLNRLPEQPGTQRALRATRLLFEGAASPMEAKTALLLSLPQRHGGFGLPRPQLNHPVALHGDARRAYPRATCRADIMWPEMQFDIEYDGADSHDGFESRARDVARTTALTLEGIEVLPLTYPQVADPQVFASVAQHIAKSLNARLRVRSTQFAARSAALRSDLGIS